jgi:hypothetical protein
VQGNNVADVESEERMRDTIDMAREAGFNLNFRITGSNEALDRLVEFVRADEREACAKVCERKAEVMAITGKSCDPDDLANAIRARSQA